jgi:hypothetical protein
VSPLLEIDLSDVASVSAEGFEDEDDPQLNELWVFTDILAENLPRLEHIFKNTIRGIRDGAVRYRFFVSDRVEWARLRPNLDRVLGKNLHWFCEPDGMRIVAVECKSPLCLCRVSLSFGDSGFLHAKVTVRTDKPWQAEIEPNQATQIKKLASLLVERLTPDEPEQLDHYFGWVRLLFPEKLTNEIRK